MFSFYLFILLFKDDFISETSLNTKTVSNLDSSIQLSDDTTRDINIPKKIEEPPIPSDYGKNYSQTINSSSLDLNNDTVTLPSIDTIENKIETEEKHKSN